MGLLTKEPKGLKHLIDVLLALVESRLPAEQNSKAPLLPAVSAQHHNTLLKAPLFFSPKSVGL